jgi:hypothetical protein
MSRSIQKTWLAILLLFALLPMLAVGGILSWMGSDLQVRQALSVQDQIALRSEALLANFVEEALMEMNILVRSPGFVSGSTTSAWNCLPGQSLSAICSIASQSLITPAWSACALRGSG